MDATFKALADPRRREIIKHVWAVERPAAEIAAFFGDVTRSAISQHLAVLREAALVTERREGVRRFYRANHSQITSLRHFLDEYWGESLNQLRSLAESAEREKGGNNG